MVKEVPQYPKYQCEHCDKIYVKYANAQKCEAKGLSEFKYNIGDEVETIIQLTKISETRINVDMPQRLFDIGGEFAKVKIIDRYYWNHKPFYTFEHPQIQGQYWKYPELAFELPHEFNEFKEPAPDEVLELKIPILGRDLIVQQNLRALNFRGLWREFGDSLKKRGLTRIYGPEVIAEPINPT